MAKYKLKYLFDWGSGVCVWTNNDAAHKLYGNYPVFTEQLPLSEELKKELNRLIRRHDEALDWDYPPADLLWSGEEQMEFIAEAKLAYERLRFELGEDYCVETHESWIL